MEQGLPPWSNKEKDRPSTLSREIVNAVKKNLVRPPKKKKKKKSPRLKGGKVWSGRGGQRGPHSTSFWKNNPRRSVRGGKGENNTHFDSKKKNQEKSAREVQHLSHSLDGVGNKFEKARTATISRQKRRGCSKKTYVGA